MLPEIWNRLRKGDDYSAPSLPDEGFIHCSFENQIKGVLGRYYSDAERVLLLEIDPEKLHSELKIEPSTNDEHYPHIYGTINQDSVVGVTEIRPEEFDIKGIGMS